MMVLKFKLWLFITCTLCSHLLFSENQAAAAADGTSTLTCACLGGILGEANKTPSSNCSTSFRCQFNQGMLSCSFDAAQTTTSQAASCFTSCNCTSGAMTQNAPPNQSVNYAAIIAVVVAAVLVAIGLIIALVWFCSNSRKDNRVLRSRIYSLDKYTTWSTKSNLISHHSSAQSEANRNANSNFSLVKEFVRMLSFTFKSHSVAIPGALIQFSYAKLEQATKKFSRDNLLGVGASSIVYRGELDDSSTVAIKRFRASGAAEEDDEFLSEIELLSRLNHCHVVPLLGYCSEKQGKQSERILVFEYMSNGNLRECLDVHNSMQPLDWNTRVNIALGAARGLEYLHEASAPRILHRDIKSTNILLDDKFRAKITDLGMAKCLMNDGITSCSSSPARMQGTFGYFAPEYAIVGKASLKSDVFSFGVVILELITGRKPIHKSVHNGEESLVIWANSRLRNQKLVLTELPDPLLQGQFAPEEMVVMAHLARECLQWDPDCRPTMSDIVQVLSTIAPNKHGHRKLPAAAESTHSSGGGVVGTRWSPGLPPEVNDHGVAMLPMAAHSEDGLREDAWSGTATREMANSLFELSLRDRSRRSEDVVVDLTEPRLEAFT